MKIEISYSEGKTIQEVAYEPRTFHVSAKCEVESKDVEQAYRTLKTTVKAELQEEIEKLKGKDITKSNETPF